MLIHKHARFVYVLSFFIWTLYCLSFDLRLLLASFGIFFDLFFYNIQFFGSISLFDQSDIVDLALHAGVIQYVLLFVANPYSYDAIYKENQGLVILPKNKTEKS
jgi:hypothetical protein